MPITKSGSTNSALRRSPRWRFLTSVLGPYSDTWPLDCPKSDKIVREAAEFFAQPK